MEKKNSIGRWMFLLLTAALLPLQALADNATNSTLSIEAFTMKAGETKEMLIDLDNPGQEVTMVEFYMYLPTGLSVAEEDGDLAIDIAGRTTLKKHSIETKQTSGGAIHVLLYSGKNTLISGTSGALLSVTLTASSTFGGGDIVLRQQLMTSPDAAKTESKPADYTYTVKMGATGSGITFKDAKVKAICVANWDTNGDGELSEEEAAAVTSLGEAFKRNAEITSFEELRDYFTGLTAIDANAFYNCTSLKSIKLPASVDEIGDAAFVGCSSLTTFDFAAKEKYDFLTLYTGVFTGCSSLTDFTVNGSKDGVIDIFNKVVDGVLFSTDSDGKLTSLGCYPAKHGSTFTVPEGIKSIDSYAFCMTEISEVTLPASLASIWGNAFTYCDKLTKVTINATIPPYIPVNSNYVTGGNAFDGTAAKAALYLPSDGMKDIYQNTDGWGKFGSYVGGSSNVTVFAIISDDIDMYYKTNGTNTVALIAIVSNIAKVEIPAQVTYGGKTYTVTEIGSGEERAMIPYAWYDFDRRFDYTVFEMYSKMEQTTYDVTEVVIPNTVKKIGNCAFRWSKIEKLEIPGSVEEIGPFAFGNCTNLSSLKLNNGLKKIGDDAFARTALESVTIPASVEYIGNNAFGVWGIQGNRVDIHISDVDAWCKVESNPLYAGWEKGYDANGKLISEREWCEAEIAEYNLYLNNKELKEVSIPEGMTAVPAVFNGIVNLEKITLPSTIEELGIAFYYCSGLKTVVNLSKNPQSIRTMNGFVGARAKTRAAGDGDHATFGEVDKDACALYVPFRSLSSYRSKSGWKDFTHIYGLGDVTGNGNIEEADVEAIVNYIMGKAPAGFDWQRADANGDGKVDAADVVTVLKIIREILDLMEAQSHPHIDDDDEAL